MSRKPNDENKDQSTSRASSFNSLIKQLEHDDSIVNHLTPDIKAAALEIPEKLVNKSEEELVEILEKDYHYTPTNTLEALRTNFWMEYDRVAASSKEKIMNNANIYFGVCTRMYWHEVTTRAVHLFAYILTRPPEYEAISRGLSSLSQKRMRDILNIPIKKPNGEFQDPKLIELVLKTAAMVDLRNRGGYLNRSETKNLTMLEMNSKTVTYHGILTDPNIPKTAEQMQLAIDEKLKELEEGYQAKLPQPKIVTDEVTVLAEYKEVDNGG